MTSRDRQAVLHAAVGYADRADVNCLNLLNELDESAAQLNAGGVDTAPLGIAAAEVRAARTLLLSAGQLVKHLALNRPTVNPLGDAP